MAKFKWGILGTGSIAHKFAEGLQAIPDAELLAVGSRTPEKADKFGAEFKVPRRHASYAALAADPDVEAIYVSTPHQLHREVAVLCLKAGKAVLCEKPFAINATEAKAMIAAARKHKKFLMEAMWTRFNPVSRKVLELVKSGAIGPVQMLHANFGFRAGWNPESRLLNPQYGGGGLLDVGVYCVSYARMIFGMAPAKVAGFAEIGQTGVDEQAVWTFKYPNGKLAAMSAGVRTSTPHEVTIMGTDGMIRVPDFWHATRYVLNGKEEKVEIVGNAYNYQAVEVQTCVRAGKLESDLLPLAETLEIIQTLDQLRAQWGLRYPMEK
jgi:predicted dehydrogenase